MSNKLVVKLATLAGLAAVTIVVSGQGKPTAPADLVEAYVKRTWASASPEWQARVTQDETQKVCSETRNNPSPEQAKAVVARETANIVYPADGNVLGNWREGAKVAQTGTGGQFSDRPGTYQGGNCYACHQMARAELSFGTLGPSLMEYGKNRKFKPEEARAAYAKIFNSQSVLACSNMPRFGHNKFLTEQQIKDVTAYLFDPESPVNK